MHLSRNYPYSLSLLLLLRNTAGKIKYLRLAEVNLWPTDTANWYGAISDDGLLLLPAPDVIDTFLLWDCCFSSTCPVSRKSFCESAKLTAALADRSVGWPDGSVIYCLMQGCKVFSLTFNSCLIYGSHIMWRTELNDIQSVF